MVRPQEFERGGHVALRYCEPDGSVSDAANPNGTLGNIAGIVNAAGNVMASAMGMTYGGAGGTLGPGMVFGFAAGRHAASRLETR